MLIATENRRIPQNVMTTGRVHTSLDRTLSYAIKPLPEGKLHLLKSLSSVSKFTKTIFIHTFMI